MTLQIIASIVVVLLLFKVWSRFKVKGLPLTQAILWSLLWLGIAVVFWQPEVTNRLADYFGIGRGADLIVYVAIVVLAYICFRIFVRIDRMDRQITKLVKKIALDEEDSSDTNS